MHLADQVGRRPVDLAVVAQHDAQASAVARGDHVCTDTTHDQVIAAAAADRVVAARAGGRALELLHALRAGEVAHLAVVAQDQVGATTRFDGVAAGAANDEVVARANAEVVIATQRHVGRHQCVEVTIPVPAQFAVVAQNEVCTRTRRHHVGAHAAQYNVESLSGADPITGLPSRRCDAVEGLGCAQHVGPAVDRQRQGVVRVGQRDHPAQAQGACHVDLASADAGQGVQAGLDAACRGGSGHGNGQSAVTDLIVGHLPAGHQQRHRAPLQQGACIRAQVQPNRRSKADQVDLANEVGAAGHAGVRHPNLADADAAEPLQRAADFPGRGVPIEHAGLVAVCQHENASRSSDSEQAACQGRRNWQQAQRSSPDRVNQ